MANDEKRRPDLLMEQREAFARTVSAPPATPAKGQGAASLDAFNAPPAAGPQLAFRHEDGDGLQSPGGGDDDDQGGTQDLNSDQEDRAKGVLNERWEQQAEEDRDGDGQADGGTNPLEFRNPGLVRIAEEMAGMLPTDDVGGQPAGSAAGQHAPGSSGGGDGSVSSSGGGGSSNDGSRVSSGGDGGMGASNAVNPITGQGMGINAYGTPGAPDLSSFGAGPAVGGVLSDPLVAHMMDRSTGQRGDGSPSVMDGGNGSNPLQAAIEYASTPEAQEETAKKAGVTPPGGDSGGSSTGRGSSADLPGAAPDDAGEEPGVVDRFVAWVKEQTSGDGGPSRYDTEIPEEVGIGGATTTNAQGSKDVGIKNLETAMSDSLGGFSNSGKPNPKDQIGPDGENDGPPTEEEIRFRTYLRQTLNYHGSPGHNEGNSTPTDELTEIPTGTVSITASRDTARVLFGQPAEDGLSRHGGGRVIGNLPGDDGAIDQGPDYTGGHTSNPITEQEGDALSGFGGSGLSISDARRDDDEEEDEEDDDSDS